MYFMIKYLNKHAFITKKSIIQGLTLRFLAYIDFKVSNEDKEAAYLVHQSIYIMYVEKLTGRVPITQFFGSQSTLNDTVNHFNFYLIFKIYF